VSRGEAGSPEAPASPPPAQEAWTEVVLRAEPALHARLLAEVVVPLVTDPELTGRSLFLRELGRQERPAMVVQVLTGASGAGGAGLAAAEPAAGASPAAERAAAELAERARRLAAVVGPVEVAAGPARTVPLAGSAFDGPALASVGRRFLARVTPVLAGPAVASRATVRFSGALDLMAAHLRAVVGATAPGAEQAAAALGAVPLSFLSFRSHAEAFIAGTRDPEATRRVMDARYETVRGSVDARVRAVLAQAEGRGPVVSEPAGQWHDAVRAAKPGMANEFHVEGITTDGGEGPADGTGALAKSRFHTAVGASAELSEFLGADPEFLAVRLLTSLLYLSLHNLGMSLMERYLLCHLVSRACESLAGVDAMAVLDRMASR
jgi:Lantibiotic biosynthesis dehydratase C-term